MSTIFGANWRLANAKSSMLQKKQTVRRIRARNTYLVERERKSSVLYHLEIGNKGKSFVHHTNHLRKAALWLVEYFCRPGRFWFLRSFWEHSELYKRLATCWLLALANSVCLLTLSRSDRHVLALLLCARLMVLRCAYGRCSTAAYAYILFLFFVFFNPPADG